MIGKRSEDRFDAVLVLEAILHHLELELADRGSLYRIVSFIVVGLLLLLVGYFAPVPPKRPAEDSPAPAA